MQQPSPEQIRSAVCKVIASGVFTNAERMRRFLEFIVDHTLRAPEEPLKETIVGLELYAAGGDFDPRISSVVRVQELRTAKFLGSSGCGAAADEAARILRVGCRAVAGDACYSGALAAVGRGALFGVAHDGAGCVEARGGSWFGRESLFAGGRMMGRSIG